MMRIFLFFTALLTPLYAGATAPVVVEFFESPQCSPTSADHGHSHPNTGNEPKEKFTKSLPYAVFHNMALNNPNVIALKCQIDYSSYDKNIIDQHRKKIDEFCGNRQYGYGKALKFYERQLSPNILVNGEHETTGEMDNVLYAAIKMAEAEAELRPLDLSIRDNTLDISLPKLRLDRPADIWLFTSNASTHAITDFKQLPYWDGRYYNLSLPIENITKQQTDNHRFTMVIQDPTTAKIIAAGQVKR